MSMKIIIDYHSTWQNSFLIGSNDEPIKKREFKASSKSDEKPDVKPITYNTVLGVLSRLIGDQRKLFQAKEDDSFYFKNMPISFQELEEEHSWTETVMLINKKNDRPSPSGFIGFLDENEPLFFSENAYRIWGLLDFDFDEILHFIVNPTIDIPMLDVSPRHVLDRLRYDINTMDAVGFIDNIIKSKEIEIEKETSKDKPNSNKLEKMAVELERLFEQKKDDSHAVFEKKLYDCISILENKFQTKYIESNNTLKPLRLYVGSLHIMLDLLQKENIDISPFLGDRGGLQGFSKIGFNGVRDFLNSKMGGRKKTVKTPYNLTKASGQLEITLDIEVDTAKELKQMIENAGVSSFYLGKKGLAYVSDIRLR